MQVSSSSQISVRIRVETGRRTSLATQSMKLRNSLAGAESAPPFRDCCTQTDSGRRFSSVSGISLCGSEFEIPVLLGKSPLVLVVDASPLASLFLARWSLAFTVASETSRAWASSFIVHSCVDQIPIAVRDLGSSRSTALRILSNRCFRSQISSGVRAESRISNS